MPRDTTMARIIEVDFPYDASVVYSGFRKPKNAQFLSRAAVSVREVGAAALLPVLEITGSYARHMHADLQDPGTITVHAFEGGLWTALTDHDGRPISVDELARPDVRRERVRQGNPFDLNQPHLNVADPAFQPFRVDPDADFPEITIDKVHLRSVVATRREEAAANAQRVADSLLIVEGRVMYRCHEPFWSAHPYKKDEACLVFGPEDAFEGHLRMETFRADRREDLLAWRLRWAEADSGSPPVSRLGGSVRILANGHLRRDDLKYLCRDMEGISSESFRFFREADASALLHWIVLRDRARELKTEWSRASAMSALDSLAVLRDAFAKAPVRGYDYSKNVFESAHRACRRLLARAHWYEGWSNPTGVDLSTDDAAAIEAMDDWKLPAAVGGS
jgi:hypothetical protein